MPIKLSLFIAVSLSMLVSIAHAADKQTVNFKHFSDYHNMHPTEHSDPSICRTHIKAQQKVNDREPNPLYRNNHWKLVMRRGLYRAQVEKTMSVIYQHFLGYSTDVDFVEEKGDYFIGRREFNQLTKWEDAIKKIGNQFYINGFLLKEDGSLQKGSEIKKMSGLASLAVLTKFFADSDAEDFNYGVLENENSLRVVDWDNEHAFDFDSFDPESADIEKDLEKKLGTEFIHMSWFQNEKQTMLKKIAQTDFSVIEKMVRENLNVSRLNETKWLCNKLLRDSTVFPTWDRKEVQKLLDEVNELDENQFGVNQIVDELRKRHQTLQRRFMRG